jgi:hypothetical protein
VDYKINPKISFADKIKKLKNGLKMHIYKDLGEEKGKMPETNVIEKDGKVQAVFETKDNKTLSTSANLDAQKNGTFENIAKKAGVKKEDVTYTAATMQAAQADLTQKKDLDNNRKAEKEKLFKTIPKNSKIKFSNIINYKKIDGPKKIPVWKAAWNSKSWAEKEAFKKKLLAQRMRMGKADEEMKDDDSYMAMKELQAIMHHLMEIKEKFDPKKDLPDWLDSKITLASDKLAVVAHYLDHKNNSEKTVTEKHLEKAGRCWDGYKPVPGKKPYSKGSCEKIEKNMIAGYQMGEMPGIPVAPQIQQLMPSPLMRSCTNKFLKIKKLVKERK